MYPSRSPGRRPRGLLATPIAVTTSGPAAVGLATPAGRLLPADKDVTAFSFAEDAAHSPAGLLGDPHQTGPPTTSCGHPR
ncbi:hypothetical protein [Streptosporangium subroseum]|uniref:hypothetical protein n=1 Tax=Streptosporangium subroseum TaxID=106412 RepID=UPI00308CD084|nr:hypothetical protein OHB15_18960 [Streptosporangium subroseum]